MNDASTNTILQHLKRYRLTTFEVLRRLPEFRPVGAAGVRQVLRDLEGREMLGSALLSPDWRYWHLTPSGAVSCRIDAERSGPLSHVAATKALSMLYFCHLSDQPRIRLTAEELASRAPEGARQGLPNTYYFCPAGSGTLGLLRLDAGRTGRWDRILHSVRSDIRMHQRHPLFRPLVASGRFEITIQTFTVSKATRIRIELPKISEASIVPIQVLAQPELLRLVNPDARKEAPHPRSS